MSFVFVVPNSSPEDQNGDTGNGQQGGGEPTKYPTPSPTKFPTPSPIISAIDDGDEGFFQQYRSEFTYGGAAFISLIIISLAIVALKVRHHNKMETKFMNDLLKPMSKSLEPQEVDVEVHGEGDTRTPTRSALYRMAAGSVPKKIVRVKDLIKGAGRGLTSSFKSAPGGQKPSSIPDDESNLNESLGITRPGFASSLTTSFPSTVAASDQREAIPSAGTTSSNGNDSLWGRISVPRLKNMRKKLKKNKSGKKISTPFPPQSPPPPLTPTEKRRSKDILEQSTPNSPNQTFLQDKRAQQMKNKGHISLRWSEM